MLRASVSLFCLARFWISLYIEDGFLVSRGSDPGKASWCGNFLGGDLRAVLLLWNGMVDGGCWGRCD